MPILNLARTMPMARTILPPPMVKNRNGRRSGSQLQACLLNGRRQTDLDRPSLMQRGVRRPVAALELLAGAAWTWIVAAGIRCLVEQSHSFPWHGCCEPRERSGQQKPDGAQRDPRARQLIPSA